MSKKYRVIHFEGSRLSKNTVLRIGSIIALGSDDGSVSIIPGGKWATRHTCEELDFVGIARVGGKNHPEIWYSIQVMDDCLRGAFYEGNPCGGLFPSVIAEWEAERAVAMRRRFRVTQFDRSSGSESTALKLGSIVQIGADDGWVYISPGGKWDTYPTCNDFNYVGIAKVGGRRSPDIWYSIQVRGDGLQGALYDGHPCEGQFPSAIATWEAEEEEPVDL